MGMPRRPDQYERPPGIGAGGGFPSSSARKQALDLVDMAGQVFPAGVGVTVYNQPFIGASYQVALDFLTLVAPAVPVVKISMLWKNRKGGVILGLQHWFVTITNVAPANGNGLVTGRGPADADFLQVIIKNLDTTDVTGDFLLVQSGLPQIARHDWRSASNNILGTYTFNGVTFSTPVSDCPNNMLGYVAGIGPNLPHGQAINRLYGLYAGEVQLCVQLGLALNTAVVQVFSIDPEFASPMPQIYPNQNFATTAFVADLTLPRGPVIIALGNNDAAVDTSASITLLPKEFAS
jgi:hypothetical protein